MAGTQLLTGLNASQVAAVTHVDGPLLVLAGPGSGKTRVVTHRIAYLIEQGISPQSMVALTFTNKAAQEMRTRVEQLVGGCEVWLGTFHGFCVRLLRRYARLVGLPENFNIYDVDDAQAALKAAIQKSNFELTHISLGALANRISFYKNRLITPEILEAEALSSEEHTLSRVYPYYQQELLHNAAVDFDDILMHIATLLRSHPELRAEWDERLQYVMVDEYQDTNLAQYVIIRHLCVDHPNLAATGDPDQSIYGWRGANAKNVTNLERDYPALKLVRLENNYRSTPEILSAADYLIQHNEYRKPKQLVPSRDPGSPVRLVSYASARDEAEDIADQIAAIVDHDGQYSDFGVLYRTNAQSRLFEQALMRRQIPFQLIGGYRFYLRKEIKDLVAYLLLVNNPEDDVALMRAINSPPRGIGKQTLAKIRAHADAQSLSMLDACRECAAGGQVSKRAAGAVRAFLKILDQLGSLVHGPLVDLLQTTIELTHYREYLAKQQKQSETQSDVSANLDELLAEAHEIDQEPTEEQTPLERFLEFAALNAETDRLDSQQDVVTLMTLHAAKGLEFRHVYIAAVEENILPHSRSKDDLLELEEERRLLFVGITRAEETLQLSYAKSRGFSSQGSGVPSSFLLELPRLEMQVIDRAGGYGGAFMRQPGGSMGRAGGDPWDELSQLTEFEADENAAVDWDDCQLPPEELASRLRGTQSSSGSASGRLRVAADMAMEDEDDGEFADFRVGCVVSHPEFGSGEIVAVSGRSAKRSATILFFDDDARRTFRLSHVTLEIIARVS